MASKNAKNSSLKSSAWLVHGISLKNTAREQKHVKNEDILLYSHNVDEWIRRHIEEIPERFRGIFHQFVRYCRRTGVREVTLYTYLPRVRNFLQYLEEQGIENICNIDEDLIYDFLKNLEESGLSDSKWTEHRYLSIIKKFLRFLIERKICPELREVYEKVKVRTPDNLPPTINLELIRLVDEFIAKIPDLKYRTLYCILRETGARIGEVLRLKLSDVRETDIGYELIIRRSKSKPRTVFVIKYQDVLRAWLSVHPGWDSEDRSKYYLFYGRDPAEPLRRHAITMYMRKLVEKLGYADKFRKLIGRPFPNPHLLRHIRAYELVHLVHARKLSEKEIRQLMGWKTPRMVDVYVELLPEDLKRAYLRTLGLEVPEVEEEQKTQEAPRCPRCGFVNPAGARYCAKCGLPLTLPEQLERAKQEKTMQEIALHLLKKLIELVRDGQVDLHDLYNKLLGK